MDVLCAIPANVYFIAYEVLDCTEESILSGAFALTNSVVVSTFFVGLNHSVSELSVLFPHEFLVHFPTLRQSGSQGLTCVFGMKVCPLT